MSEPAQAEIWWVKFDPVVGAEIRKTRPAIVLSRDSESRLGMSLAVPLTTWREDFARHRSKVRILSTPQNGPPATSAADLMQLRGLSNLRFDRPIGKLSDADFRAVGAALSYVTSRRG